MQSTGSYELRLSLDPTADVGRHVICWAVAQRITVSIWRLPCWRSPHVIVDSRGNIWLDARGLDATGVAARALTSAGTYVKRARPKALGSTTAHRTTAHRAENVPRAGVAGSAIAAEVAAVHGHAPLVTVPAGMDATFLAPFPLAVLGPTPRVAAACEDARLATCGDLARLPREAVEGHLGADGIALWRLTRAEDPRRILSPVPCTLPSASLGWKQYAMHAMEQLVVIADHVDGSGLRRAAYLERGGARDGART